MRIFTLAFASLSLAGCASMFPPSAERLAHVPVLEIGQTVPADGDYILHIATGKPVPFKLDVTGDAVAQPGSATTSVESRREVYLYKQWASLDGKTWQRSYDLFRLMFSVGFDTQGGMASVRIDEAPR